MGIRRIEQLKRKKPFSPWDILPYAVILCVIGILFILFVFMREDKIRGVDIYSENTLICSYSFTDGLAVTDGYDGRVSAQAEEGMLFLTVYDEAGGFNRLLIDKQARSVRVIDADCSFHRDCTLMKEITTNEGVIVCLPHGLKIVASGEMGVDSELILG